MPFDLIDQRSCNHVSCKAPCKCTLDIIIIIYTQTYVYACNCMHMNTCVVPVDEPGTTLYICTNNIIHNIMHAHTLFAKSGNQQAPMEAQ